MGIVHVLTGPDHLSALATLSAADLADHSQQHVDSRWSKKGKAFLLGVRWGIGHSVGLLTVGGILIAIEEGSSNEWIGMDNTLTTVLESFVGVFMLVLGTYGLIKALRNREDAASSFLVARRGSIPRDLKLDHDDRSLVSGSSSMMLDDVDEEEQFEMHLRDSVLDQMEEALEERSSDSYDDAARKHRAVQSRTGNMMLYSEDDASFSSRQLNASMVSIPMVNELFPHHEEPSTSSTRVTRASTLIAKHTHAINNENNSISSNPMQHNKNYKYITCCGLEKCCFCTPGALALATGIIHGVAGPGGVLGVIPAVQLRNPHLAFVYLSTFCITSTLVMGGFALFYGALSKWLAGGENLSRVFLVEASSACLSIVVGIVWLVLLSLGKLENVFP